MSPHSSAMNLPNPLQELKSMEAGVGHGSKLMGGGQLRGREVNTDGKRDKLRMLLMQESGHEQSNTPNMSKLNKNVMGPTFLPLMSPSSSSSGINTASSKTLVRSNSSSVSTTHPHMMRNNSVSSVRSLGSEPRTPAGNYNNQHPCLKSPSLPGPSPQSATPDSSSKDHSVIGGVLSSPSTNKTPDNKDNILKQLLSAPDDDDISGTVAAINDDNCYHIRSC